MATEIERKFIVKGDFSKEVCDSQRIVQGYICSQPGRTVRIRIRGEKGFLTIKGPSDDKGLSRYEFEQEIPLPDAEHTWEVDVFHGANEGLVMAEIELASEDEPFEKPDWIGEEVSGDRRYYNSMLTKEPYSQWTKK